MTRHIFGLMEILFLIFASLAIKQSFLVNREELFYTLKEVYNFPYSPNRLYYVNYYLNEKIDPNTIKEKILADASSNQIYLESKEVLFTRSYNNVNYKLIKLGFYLAKPLVSYDFRLELEYVEKRFSLSLGEVNISGKASDEIQFNLLAIHYKYINNNLLPAGISLAFNDDIEIKRAKINEYVLLNLGKAINQIPKEAILDEKFLLPNEFQESTIKLRKNEKMFIPFYYKEMKLINKMCLEIQGDYNFFVELPIGLISYKNLADYPGFITGGGYA